jgi:hypothetical protein
MDPVTLAIVAAVTAGITASAGKVAEKAVLDAYEGLKGLIKKKFGGDGQVPKAIADLEGEPDFKPYQEGLKQRIEVAKVHNDPEILKAAQALLDLLQDKPAGAQAIQHVQHVYGDYSAAAGPYGTATVNIGQPPKKE